jgi:replicative DNA helicase
MPIGPIPCVAELLVGALLYSTAAEASTVLGFVADDDVDWPLEPIVAAVRRLAAGGAPPAAQLVADELRRGGKLDRQIGVALASATTTGACGSAARSYAAAVVAESLRRRVESAGAALQSAAAASAEAELAPLVERAAAQARDCADRLAALRGGDL